MIVFTTALLFKGSNLPVGLKNGEWLISSYHNHFKSYSFQKTLADIYPELKKANVYNPIWSIRAMLLYNQWLDARISSADQCEQWAMVLSSYNGGLNWLNKDKLLSKTSGANPNIWWDNVELYSSRANWAMVENRDYPRKVIFQHQAIYENWGNKYIC